MWQCTRNLTDCAPVWRWRLAMMLVLWLLSMGAVRVAMGAAARQKSFPAPEEGVRALIEAAQKNDTTTLLAILGPEAKSFVNTGDPVSDRENRERFLKSYEEAHTLVQSGDTKVVVQIGKDEWPFPIPLIKGSAGWRFDTQEGKAELRNRRIGRNELDVIQVCLAYVDAQREYYVRNPMNATLLQYAPKFISTKGKRDGLYWKAPDNESPSPLGSPRGPGQTRGLQACCRQACPLSRLLLQNAHRAGTRCAGWRL